MLQAQGESPSSFIVRLFDLWTWRAYLLNKQNAGNHSVYQKLSYFHCAGVEVPSKDSVPKKKPVYGDKRKKKPNAPTPEGTALLLLVSSPSKTSTAVSPFCPS